MSRRSDRRQARVAAQLKYGQQNDALSQILSGLRSDLDSNVAQAQAAGHLIARSARRGVPQLAKAYRPALKGSGAAAKFVASEIAARPENDPFRVAAAVDVGGSRKALAGELADAQREMVNRATEARVGTAQRVAGLQGQYRTDALKVIDQLSANKAQQGLYASTLFGDLRKDAADRRTTRRGQDITARGQTLTHKDRVADRKARERAAREKAREDAKPKHYHVTPTQQGAAQDKIKAAIRDAKRLNNLKDSNGHLPTPQQLLDKLLHGDTDLGVSKTDSLYAHIAVHVARHGFINHKQVKELRKRGIRPKQLGIRLKPPSFLPNTGQTFNAGGVEVHV